MGKIIGITGAASCVTVTTTRASTTSDVPAAAQAFPAARPAISSPERDFSVLHSNANCSYQVPSRW
jgi:hypothetical protein